jgi:hypothetical protein
MRKGLLIVAVCGALMLAPGLVTAAHAGHSWLAVGTAFRIGPAFISVVLAPSGYDYPYFYRFDRPLAYRGAGCGPGCFVEDDYYYYPSDCPLVTTYFGRYGVDPYQVYHRYAPRYSGRGYRGPDGYGSYSYYGGRSYDRYYDHRGAYPNRGHYNDNRYGRGYDRGHDRRYDGHRDHRDDDRYRHDRRFDGHRDRRDDGRYRRDRDDHRGRGYDRDSHHRGHR